MKKFFILFMLLSFVFSACGKDNSDGGSNGSVEDSTIVSGETERETEPASPPERDLGGMEINIANWWASNCTDTVTPDAASGPSGRARWDDRRLQEEIYNFKIREVQYGSWHDVRDNLTSELLGGNRDFQAWIMIPSWFATNHHQRLFAPIPAENFDFDSGIEWSRSVYELTMRDDVPHGFAHGVGMASGVYFNMRLLEEAGVSRDLPYTLQRENNWTWETFTEMARLLSRDIDGDGITDIWAITSFHQELLAFALASNNAAYATIDPITGSFVSAIDSDAFRETIEWVVSLREEGLAMHEDDVGGAWNVFIEMFDNGQGAIRTAPNYVAGNIQLEDDWGFVAFPRGPRSDVHMAWVTQDINAIPHFYSEDEVNDIMFAIQRWIRPLEDSDPNDWMIDARSNHRDARSYTETMALYTRNAALQTMPAHVMMPGLGDLLDRTFAHRVWNGTQAAVIIEEAEQIWNAFIDRVNNM